MTYSHPLQYDGGKLLEVSGLRDIIRYDAGQIDKNPRDYYYYGTNGLICSNQPSLLTCMGEIDKDSEFLPGIRCANISDALAVQAGISQIVLGDILFDTSFGTGTAKDGERLHTYNPINETLHRRRYGDLSLGDVKPWEEGGLAYEQQPPLISGEKLLKYQAAFPGSVVSAFFATHYNVPSNQVIPWIWLGQDMYWETEGQGDDKRRTGKVYIDCSLGQWYPSETGETDHKGFAKELLSFIYTKYTPNKPPFELSRTIYLTCGLQPSDMTLLSGGHANYFKNKQINEYRVNNVTFEMIFYKFSTGDVTWEGETMIFDYIEDVS